MSSKKCPNCGLVNFATASICSRCKYDLASAPIPVAGRQEVKRSAARFTGEQPYLAALITFSLLIFNGLLAYGQSQRKHISSAETVGYVLGSEIAWPAVLIVVYCISRSFREKYSMLAVINYGLAVNTVINLTLTLAVK